MKYYVYELAYPDGVVFYIGKGQGDRILEHEAEARRGVQSLKCDIIREIKFRGEEVLRRKLAFFDTEEEALRYEAHLIDSLDGLANIQPGRKRFPEMQITPRDHYRFGVSISSQHQDGSEYWKAREVAKFLGYTTWEAFNNLISRAKKSLQQTNIIVEEHFISAHTIISIGYGTERIIEDYHLSRLAFLLLVLLTHHGKSAASIGKHYITKLVMIAEDKSIQGLFSSKNAHSSDLLSHGTLLFTALLAGVPPTRLSDFFDAGFLGLYGCTLADLKWKREIPEQESFFDNVTRAELSAIDFKNTQTEGKLLSESINGLDEASQAHYFVGNEVRKAIEAIGQPMPEDLPSATSIRKMVEERRRKQKKVSQAKEQKPDQERLF